MRRAWPSAQDGIGGMPAPSLARRFPCAVRQGQSSPRRVPPSVPSWRILSGPLFSGTSPRSPASDEGASPACSVTEASSPDALAGVSSWVFGLTGRGPGILLGQAFGPFAPLGLVLPDVLAVVPSYLYQDAATRLGVGHHLEVEYPFVGETARLVSLHH